MEHLPVSALQEVTRIGHIREPGNRIFRAGFWRTRTQEATTGDETH